MGEVAEDPHIRGMIDKFEVTRTLPEHVLQHLHPEGINRNASKVRPTFRVRMENLPTKSTCDLIEEQIRALLKKLGASNPIRLEVTVDPITSRPQGCGFADFQDAAAADLCTTG